jgi:hypothetical protein
MLFFFQAVNVTGDHTDRENTAAPTLKFLEKNKIEMKAKES